MKLQLTTPGTVCRRGNQLIVTTENGELSKVAINDEPSEPSPCMKRLKRKPGYRDAYREGMRIYRNPWRSPWWDRQYEMHHHRFHSHYFSRLQDYIIGRILLEVGSKNSPVIQKMQQ